MYKLRRSVREKNRMKINELYVQHQTLGKDAQNTLREDTGDRRGCVDQEKRVSVRQQVCDPKGFWILLSDPAQRRLEFIFLPAGPVLGLLGAWASVYP